MSMQGCLNHQRPSDLKTFIYSGDGNKIQVEVIGHFRIFLNTEFYLNNNDFSFYSLDKNDFFCKFENSLFLESKLVDFEK
jgi:hypothetical protein